MTPADPRDPFTEAERRKMLEAKTMKDAKRIRDDYRAKCIEAMHEAYIKNGHLSSMAKIMQRILDSLHGLVRVAPVEATEEMINASYEKERDLFGPTARGLKHSVIFAVMSAAGDLTIPPEKKP